MNRSTAVLEKVAAKAVDSGLADAWYFTAETPLGRLLVVETAGGLCRVSFAHEDFDAALDEIATKIGARIVASADKTERTRAQLERYLRGELTGFDVSVDLRLVPSEFYRDVLRAARRIPRGRVATYGAVAAATRRPGAVRAAGTALGRNPVPIVVPCHRVVPASGGIGNYGGGTPLKDWLLRLEGARDAVRPRGVPAVFESSEFGPGGKATH